MWRKVSFCFLFLIFSTPARPEDDEELPLLHSVDGDRIVVIVTPQGNREVEAGSRVHIGDRVRTGPRASAKIIFKDGTKLIIGRLTELEVQKPIAGKIPSGFLRTGQVRGVVPKTKTIPEKPRFMLKTQAAVMGVRGTDFVYEAAENGIDTTLHTLEGSVQIARTEKEILDGTGVQVTLNHRIRADGQGISQPERFNRLNFLDDMGREQPYFISAGQNDRSLLIQKDLYEPPPAPKPERKLPLFDWTLFQLGIIKSNYEHQTCGNCSKTSHGDFGTRLSWNPTMHLGGWVGLRTTFGGSWIQPGGGASREWHTMIGLGITPDILNPFIAEAGPMLEFWPGGFHQAVVGFSALVGWKFSDDGFVERVFASISSNHWERVSVVKTCKDSKGKSIRCDETESHEGSQLVVGLGFHL